MKIIVYALLLLASLPSVGQTSKTSKKTNHTVSPQKTAAAKSFALALVEMKEAFKSKIAERNAFVTAFIIGAYQPEVKHLHEAEEQLDKIPTDKTSRDKLLLALARYGGQEEIIIEQLYVVGVRPASARLLAAYALRLNAMTQQDSSNDAKSVPRPSASMERPLMPSSGNDEAKGEADTIQEEVPDSKVYVYVEKMPELPSGGGNAAITAAIQKASRYPALALRNQVEGRVFVSFTVGNTGAISAIRVVKGLGSGLDEETIKAVASLPQLVPGRQNGRPVSVSMTLPITWRIQ